ncbi:MAG: serine protease, partial [Candidatus Pacearchaeota archaeon]
MITRKEVIIGTIILIIVIVLTVLISASISKNYYQNHFSKVSKEVVESTIVIGAIIDSQHSYAFCSGVIIDERGYILTAYHCFNDHKDEFNNLGGNNFNTSDIIYNYGYINLNSSQSFKVIPINNPNLERKDLQLLKVLSDGEVKLPACKIAEKKDVLLGLDVGFIGYNSEELDGFQMFISKGILSNINSKRPNQVEPYYTINAIATFGYSGGPVFLSK